MNKLSNKIKSIELLTNLISNNANVNIIFGYKSWSYNPDYNTLTVNINDLLEHDFTYNAAIIMHELGHLFISRYLIFKEYESLNQWEKLLLNALEDTRCDKWMIKKFPGSKPWFEASYSKFDNEKTHTSPLIMFLNECIFEAERNFSPDHSLTDLIKNTLSSTRSIRKIITYMLPETCLNNLSFDHNIYRTYIDEIETNVALEYKKNILTYNEIYIRYCSWQVFRLVLDSIIPLCKYFYQEASKSYNYSLINYNDTINYKNDPDFFQNLERSSLVTHLPICPAEQNNELTAKINNELNNFTLKRKTEILKNNQKMVYMISTNSSLNAKLSNKFCSFADIKKDTHRQITDIYNKLSYDYGRNPKKLKIKSSANSSRINFKKLFYHYSQSQKKYDFWYKRNLSDDSELFFSILVDCSQSMLLGRIEESVKSTYILCEAFNKLSIPFEVNGFQDKLINIFSYENQYNNQNKHDLLRLVLEAYGNCPLGNNRPEFNDDAPCLLQAAEKLNNINHAATKYLLVISDGTPCGATSGTNELHKIIRLIKNKYQCVSLIALGIGQDTNAITKFYDRSVGNLTVDSFPSEFIRLIDL